MIKRPLFPPLPPLRPNGPLGPDPVGGGGTRHGGLGGAPIAFHAAATVTANAGKVNVGTLNAQTLGSGFRSAYWIDEIHVQAWTAPISSSEGPERYLDGLGGVVRLKFQTGQFAFSKVAVPMSLYAPIWSQNESVQINIRAFGDPPFVVQPLAEMRWPLPKPLYMTPGDTVLATVEYDLLNYANVSTLGEDLNIDVTYVGRYVAPGSAPPAVRQIPWAAWFEANAQTAWQHTNDQLRNPLTRPLHIQRLTNRIYRTDSTLSKIFFSPTFSHAESDSTEDVAMYFEARMYDSQGYAIVPDYAPIGDIFNTTVGAWTFNRDLEPREQFDLMVRSTGTAPTDLKNIYAQFGMVGYRDEET